MTEEPADTGTPGATAQGAATTVDDHPEWSGRPAGDYLLNVAIDTGGEGPVAVLLHGINSDGSDWAPVVAKLPAFRCIAIDMLGWGKSPKPLDVKYSSDDHAVAIRATLDDLGVRGPFLLVGYSLGGDVALRYAARYPNDIRRLFLLSAPFYLSPEDFGAKDFSRNFVEQLVLKRLWKFVRRLPSRQAKLFDRLTSPADRLGQIAKDVIRTDDVDRQWKILSANLTNTISAADFARDLPKVKAPTVFALGVRDPIVRPDQTPQLKRFKADIEIRRIVGLTADHFMLLNLPETVAAEILRDEIGELHVGFHGGGGDAGAVGRVAGASDATPPFVFLHGLQSTSRYWRPVSEALAADGEEALTIDLIGFGESPKPLSWRYTVEDHVDMVRRTLLAELGSGPVRLVGHDLGALVAVAYAARYPHAVSELVLVSPVVFLSEEQRTRYPGVAFPDGQEAFDRAYGNVAGRLRTALEAGVVARTMGEAQQQRAVPVLRSLEEVVGEQDVPGWMDDVRSPVRVVYGRRDDMVVPEFLDALVRDADDGRGAVTVTAVDAGHNPPFDAPAETLTAIAPSASPGATERVLRDSAGYDWRAGSSAIRAILASTDATLVIRGALMFLGGLGLGVFSIVNHLPQRLFVLLFAGFILVWSAQQVLGAVGLRNARRQWLSFALLGALGAGLSIYLMLNPELSWSLLLLVIGFQAIVTGLSDLYVASRVTKGARPRWLLYLEGGLAVLLAIVVVFGPYHGESIVAVMAVGYLMIEGGLMLAYAAGTQVLLMRSRTA